MAGLLPSGTTGITHVHQLALQAGALMKTGVKKSCLMVAINLARTNIATAAIFYNNQSGYALTDKSMNDTAIKLFSKQEGVLSIYRESTAGEIYIENLSNNIQHITAVFVALTN